MYLMCRIFKITESSYYRWIKRGKKIYKVKFNWTLAKKILKIYRKNMGMYGAPRITIDLFNKYGVRASEKKVWRYMSILSIKSFVRKKRSYSVPKEKKNTKSGIPNIVDRKWGLYGPNELFVTDVSYIPYGNHKFAYLSVIKDAYSGMIVAWHISLKNDLMIWKNTLKKFEKVRPKTQIIMHSDNGFQYTSLFMAEYSKNNNIIQSCSRAGNSLDNAMCETFFSSLKTERLHHIKLNNHYEVYDQIDNYINYYNNYRITIKHRATPTSIWNTYN
ncbi:hypothetical protein SCHIN_v1c07930 [Spiroplasma chinense]|uniref:Integrase catalytic domain-containing protein n=1 Tax=Spiroplasma chinense TaxID=216932 RepID=A0A5B9Y5E3_9MOLU|nr:hypothetical protein SCHIN_v1c02280 [Spiroplasma chinense]QEH61477.1 hypothetical protein SCHIN_v1c02800 [Spiroplasma chinense]QEH61988.1 hypothetical protein SCHIN_v1c07930 [Spiroplasma chinense]